MKTITSAFSQSLGLYVSCVEEDGFVTETHLTPRPRGEETANGVAGMIVRFIESGEGDLSSIRIRPHGTDFQRRVWTEIRKIPPGTVLTYGEVAARVGSPGAARAIGSAMKSNPIVVVVPCHRIVSSTGLGGYSAHGGIRTKERLLELERVHVGLDPEHQKHPPARRETVISSKSDI